MAGFTGEYGYAEGIALLIFSATREGAWALRVSERAWLLEFDLLTVEESVL